MTNTERVASELDHLRNEYSCQQDTNKSAQLYAAMQALEWVVDPNVAAAPGWVILAGKVAPLMGTQGG